MQLRARILCVAVVLCACTAESSPAEGGTSSSSDVGESTSTTATTDATTSTQTTDDPTDDADTTTSPPSTTTDTDGPVGCTPGPVRCEDQMVLDLSLNAVVSAGEVASTADGEGWRTEVDARAGGLPGAPTNPWVYIRFAADGAHRVDIDDFQSLESDEWHIAAKRYGLRLNSGTGGPSCVTTAPVFDLAYEDIVDRPSVLTQVESFYDPECNIISDRMGLGAPGFAMTPWWTYPGCVATTGVPFVIDLPDGSSIKFTVDAYYASGQDTCNTTGAMGDDAGRFVWRWAFLP